VNAKSRKYYFLLLYIVLFTSASALHAADLTGAEKAVRTRDYAKAFVLYQQGAIAGDAEAQYQLANLYQLGKGTSKNDEKAMQWMQKSAATGHAAAQYGIALKQIKGDSENALSIMKKSAAQGYVPAVTYLKRLQDSPKVEEKTLNNNIELWFGFARKNNVSALMRLHSAGIAIDQVDADGRTALFNAIEFDSQLVVDWLLGLGAKPDHQDKFGNTPVLLAVAKGKENILQKLLNHEVDVSQTLANGDNLLHYALRLNQAALIPFLIKKGVPINQQNSSALTPLDMAESAKEKNAIASLKAAGAQRANLGFVQKNSATAEHLVGSAGVSNLTLLDLAKLVVSSNVTLTTELLDKRPDLINQPLNDGTSLLMLAVKHEDSKMVSVLLKAGAKVNQKGLNGDTPLHQAALLNNIEVINLLLRANADPLLLDDKGDDVITWAIKRGETSIANTLITKVLSEKTINPKPLPVDDYILLSAQNNKAGLVVTLASEASTPKKDDSGRDALWYAASNQNIDLISQLLKMGFVSEVDKQGASPFFVAIQTRCLNCAKQLLAISDVNQPNLTGTTPLMIAAAAGDLELTEWLLNQKADIDLRNDQGNTALINAVQANATDLVRILVEMGANVSRKNKLGFSALDIAKKQNPEIYKILKSKSVMGIF
jgi:uncharacterized protein